MDSTINNAQVLSWEAQATRRRKHQQWTNMDDYLKWSLLRGGRSDMNRSGCHWTCLARWRSTYHTVIGALSRLRKLEAREDEMVRFMIFKHEGKMHDWKVQRLTKLKLGRVGRGGRTGKVEPCILFLSWANVSCRIACCLTMNSCCWKPAAFSWLAPLEAWHWPTICHHNKFTIVAIQRRNHKEGRWSKRYLELMKHVQPKLWATLYSRTWARRGSTEVREFLDVLLMDGTVANI